MCPSHAWVGSARQNRRPICGRGAGGGPQHRSVDWGHRGSRCEIRTPFAGCQSASSLPVPMGTGPSRCQGVGHPGRHDQLESASRRGRNIHGSRHHAPAAGVGRPLRTPDPPVEPEDEAVHPHRPQRHLHHRSEPGSRLPGQRLRVRQGDRRPRRQHPVHRHEEAGTGSRRSAGAARRHAVRERALARRHAHQLPDRPPAAAAAQGARGDRLRRRRRQRHDQA